MKQRNLVKELYRACLDNDLERIQELRQPELQKTLKRRAKNKQFDAKWTVVAV